MQIELRPGEYKDTPCDMLAFPIFEDEDLDSAALKALDKIIRGSLRSVFSSREFKPEIFQTCRIFNPAGMKARHLLLIGAGKKSQYQPARLREVAGAAVRAARPVSCRAVAFLCRGDYPAGIASRVVTEGALYADYEADIYKTRDKEERNVKELFILFETPVAGREVQSAIQKGTIVGEATNFARTLANEPSNILTPSQFAERALSMGSKAGLTISVLEKEEMEKLGMNTLLAVSRGSDEPPKLIVIQKNVEGKRRSRSPIYALVGKGVTFDSGGISIKPSEKMEDMKGDMAGGAAVLGTMLALAQLQTRHSVIGLIPAVENLPSGKATKPGDVVKSYLGKTVEIINTDAEGRLILADALAYARKMGASSIIDVATLTGAIVVALGHLNAGMMGTDQKLMDRLRSNCRITGEGLWQLPLDEEYRKAIRSEIADMKNVGNRAAGAITAAKFLQEFVEDTPWVHLDIAGMDLDHDGRPFACKGATGFGVRTLVQLFEK